MESELSTMTTEDMEQIYVKEEHYDTVEEMEQEKTYEVDSSLIPQVNDFSYTAQPATDSSPVKDIIKSMSINSQKNKYKRSHYQIGSEPDSVLCLVCKKEFKSEYFLNYHISSHETIGKNYCFMCRKNFTSFLFLDQHFDTLHFTEGMYECLICMSKFNEFEELKIHFEVHVEIKPYQCHMCHAKLFREIDIVTHIDCHTQNKERAYKCSICFMSFDKKNVYSKHMKDHSVRILESATSKSKFTKMIRRTSHIKIHQEINTKPQCSVGKQFNGVNFAAYCSYNDVQGSLKCEYYDRSNLYKTATASNHLSKALLLSINCDKDNTDANAGISEVEKISDVCELEKLNVKINTDFEDDLNLLKSAEVTDSKHQTKADPKTTEIINKTSETRKLGKVARNNNQDRIHECGFCSRKFNNQSKYHRHLKHHKKSSKAILKFSISNDQIDKKSFSPHMKSHENKPDRKFECLLCGKNYKSRADLKRHVVTHEGLRPYGCVICGKKFPKSYELKIHFMTHTGETRYECSTCSKKFKKSNELTIHMMTHTGNKPYVCAVCGKTFSKNWYLKEHMRNHTGETPYECPQCQMKFKSSSNLRKHVTTHTGEKPHQCAVCESRFTKKSSLKAHNVIHTGEKPFQCVVCYKAFNGKSALRYHLKLHTGTAVEEQVLYECDYCNKLFNRKSNLKDHIRLHTGEKPHQCFICSKAFTIKSTLNKHMRVHS